MLSPDDVLLANAVDALAKGAPATSPAADEVQRSIDAWLLRAQDRRSTVGAQLARWLIGSKQTHDATYAKDCAAALTVLSTAYGADFAAIANDLGASRDYKRLVPGPNPSKALAYGAQTAVKQFGFMVALSAPTTVQLRDYADGFQTDVGFLYFSSPVRAALLRGVLRQWAKGGAAFARLVNAAQTTASELPFALTPQLPGREWLGFVLTEAIDDALYATYVVDASGGLSVPFGRDLLNTMESFIAQPPASTAGALAALRAFGAGRVGVQYDYTVKNGALSVTRSGDPAFSDYLFSAIVVPSYTPLETSASLKELDPLCRKRVELGANHYHAKLAPFVLVSGGGVYPMGTQSNDACMMRDALLALGVPADAIIVDARARHSTTNLRNAGRLLLTAGLTGPALVATFGPDTPPWSDFPVIGAMTGQDYYFAHPTISTFDSRCQGELGYKVENWLSTPSRYRQLVQQWAGDVVSGKRHFEQDLGRAITFDATLAAMADAQHAVFIASPTVTERYSLRDALDP